MLSRLKAAVVPAVKWALLVSVATSVAGVGNYVGTNIEIDYEAAHNIDVMTGALRPVLAVDFIVFGLLFGGAIAFAAAFIFFAIIELYNLSSTVLGGPITRLLYLPKLRRALISTLPIAFVIGFIMALNWNVILGHVH